MAVDRRKSSKIAWMSASNEPKKEAAVTEVVEKAMVTEAAMAAVVAAADQQKHI